ncbi:MAG: CBS domain-containing protein [Gemmatimonadota bacterium]
MNVRSILEGKGSTEVVTIDPDRTIQEAIASLVEHNIGSLVVVDERGELAGIITERDILRVCIGGGDRLATTRVAEVMTRDLIVGDSDDSIDYVMGVMTQNRVRHLPIIGRRGLRGMVSIGDVVKIQLHEKEYENRHLREYIQGSY